MASPNPGTSINADLSVPAPRSKFVSPYPMLATCIDQQAPDLDETGIASQRYPTGTRVVEQQDMSCFVAADAALLLAGTQDPRTMRITGDECIGFRDADNPMTVDAYWLVAWSNKNRLFNNGGTIAQAVQDLYNQRLFVVSDSRP